MIQYNKTKAFFHWSFFTSACLDLFAIVFSIYWMELVFKPLIMLSLIALYLVSSEKRNIWYFLALLFSLLGDIYLLDKTNMFLLGLGSFLCAQLLFIFILARSLPGSNWLQRLSAALPFAIYLISLMSLLSPGLGDFQVPVWVYATVISIFGVVSLMNFLLRRDGISGVLLLGAVLFILSDSMIALNKFFAPSDYYPAAIMLTYVLAQYFIYSYMVSADDSIASAN